MEDAVMGVMRIDRFLAECGIGSRSEVKQLMKKGLVDVNGITVKKPEFKVDAETDRVTVKGKTVCFELYEYVMLYKPAGCVTAVRDTRQKTVMEYLGAENQTYSVSETDADCLHRPDLAPVGRLDLDTEGLLLLTNDGELAHRMLAPKSHVNKTYFAKVQGYVNEEDVQAFAGGLEIGEKRPTLPAKLEILCGDDISEIELTVQEGKFHQVKRMFEARGKKVLYLKRISMGGVDLDKSLSPGQWRYLTREEIRRLYVSAGLADGS